jgi:hypothetical protein
MKKLYIQINMENNFFLEMLLIIQYWKELYTNKFL